MFFTPIPPTPPPQSGNYQFVLFIYELLFYLFLFKVTNPQTSVFFIFYSMLIFMNEKHSNSPKQKGEAISLHPQVFSWLNKFLTIKIEIKWLLI